MRVNLKQTYTFFFLALGCFLYHLIHIKGFLFLENIEKMVRFFSFLFHLYSFFIDAGFKNKIKLPIKNVFIQFLALFVVMAYPILLY